LTYKGFDGLAEKLSNEEIAQEVHGQLREMDQPIAVENWAVAVGCAAARALVKKAGLDWPEP
jgi:hypothetical protein